MAERRVFNDLSQGGDAQRFEALCEAAEQHRARRELDVPRVLEQIANHFVS